VQDQFSFSSVSCYLECNRKYFFRYATDAIDESSTDALELGGAFHDGLEAACNIAWGLRDSATPKETTQAALGVLNVPHAKAEQMLRAYIPALQLNESLFIETWQGKPALEIPFEVELAPGVQFRGMIDAVVRNARGEKLLVDWKTRGYFTEGVPAQLDAQLHLYAAAADRLGLPYDRVAQVQFAKQTPATPMMTKTGKLNRRMGKTTQDIFDRACRFYDLDPVQEREAFADKILPISAFVRVSPIEPYPDIYVDWFVDSVRRIQNDTLWTPASRSYTCKWCGFHEPCLTLTSGLGKDKA
jgi:hypothetical protein